MYNLLLPALCQTSFHTQVQAQQTEWRAITSLNQTEKLAATENNGVWAISAGGLYQYRDGEIARTITTVDGLYRLHPTEILYLPGKNKLLLGYPDGMLDLFDLETETFQQISDIHRVDTFPSKVIRDLTYDAENDLIYAAVDFGVVIYDTERFLVVDSVTKIGTFERGIPVLDLSVENGLIYSATSEGFAIGNPELNLKDAASWQVYNASNAPFQNGLMSFELLGDLIFAEDGQANYLFSDGVWMMTELGTGMQSPASVPASSPVSAMASGIANAPASSPANGPVRAFQKSSSGSALSAVQGSDLILIRPNGPAYTVSVFPTNVQQVESAYFQDEESATNSILSVSDAANDGLIYFGTVGAGLGILDLVSGQFNYPIPSGPRLNFFDGMMFDGDVFISGTTQRSQRNDLLDNTKGYVIFENGEWQNYNRLNNQQLNEASFRQAFTTAVTDEYYYFGSWGRGIVRHHKETGEITVFNAGNSVLRGWAADDDRFVVVSGLDTDNDGRVWATSRFATNPVYVQPNGDDEWTAFARPDAMQFGDEAVGLYIDSNGQKWITLQSVTTAGRGLMVVESGIPENGQHLQSVKLTDESGGGNLPDSKVNAILEDLNGEIWVGTERGIARYLFPAFIISGTSLERTAQWLLNADPDAGSAFLLRDIQVRTMAVNPANQKWVGTVNNGVWLLNSDGNRVLHHFTTSNSPLLSDAITDIEVNPKTGDVYISTDVGLMVYRDLPVEPQPAMKQLKAYPNPYILDDHDQVVIEGLTDQTTVRILTPDGQLIQRFRNRGGTAVWNGKDMHGKDVASGMYLIVALDSNGGERGIGKLVVIQ